MDIKWIEKMKKGAMTTVKVSAMEASRRLSTA